MTTLIEYLQAELHRRSWRLADLARAAGLPDATVHHVLHGNRRAGPDVCNALARALGEPPEKIFRLSGMLPELPPAVEDEREAVGILRGLPPDLREVAMRMLRSLPARPGDAPWPRGGPSSAAGQPEATPAPESAPPAASTGPIDAGDSPSDAPAGAGAPDPYLETLEQLWDKAPDWKKKDIAAQIRATVEEYQREQQEQVRGQAGGDSSAAGRPV
jgi:lambda repressor-like predicted transcriptional regulator